MPYTISHAAAILPFSRLLARWRMLSATLIGSVVPDFGYLMPWRPPRIETHSAMALITFCLPAGLVTYWVFQRFIKTAMIEVMPNATYSRWQNFALPADPSSLRQWVVATLGILFGAVTHLVWDAFTHEGARGVRMIPGLDEPYFDFVGHHLYGSRLLEDVSSLAGLAMVLLIVLYGLRPRLDGEPAPVRRLGVAERYVWVFAYFLVTLLATVLALRRASFLYAAAHSPAQLVGLCAIAALRGVAASLIMVSLALKLRLRASP